jgi:membrane protein
MDFITKIKQFFQITLWQETAEQSGALLRIALNSLRVGHIVIRELAKGELNLRAMSLVFTTLLSLVPLIAVAFSVLKAFGVHNQIEPFLLGVLEPLGPKGPEIAANIIGFVQNVDVRVLGTLGIAILFYTIISLIQKIESAFNFVWHVKRGRTLARRFTDYLSVVMIGPVLVVAAMGIAATVLNNNVVLALQAMEPFGTLILAVTKLLPYLMIITVFTFLYKFIPNTNVRFAPALIGATVAGVLWVAVGTVFASFVASSSNYTAIYSSFAILFFFMIWLYLAWFILLTGSQVAFYLQNPDLISYGDEEREELSPRLREKVGVSLMMRIAQQFYEQKMALTVNELEAEMALTNNILQDLLNKLEQGGLLVELQGDEPSYQPAQDIANISVSEVLTCLRTAEESQGMGVKVAISSDVNRLLDELEQVQQSTLQDVSLRELVAGKNKA